MLMWQIPVGIRFVDIAAGHGFRKRLFEYVFCQFHKAESYVIQVNRPCPTCRTPWSSDVPLIPNFSLDFAVEEYIKALAANGHHEWVLGGIRSKERLFNVR
jgi:hypothetical protein